MKVKLSTWIQPYEPFFSKRMRGEKLNPIDDMFYGKPGIKNYIKFWKMKKIILIATCFTIVSCSKKIECSCIVSTQVDKATTHTLTQEKQLISIDNTTKKRALKGQCQDYSSVSSTSSTTTTITKNCSIQ